MAEARISIGTLINLARSGGWDANPWVQRANSDRPANDNALDLTAFDAASLWDDIPRREWIMPPILIAKHYSMLVATGASGKSAVAITMALALVTGRNDLLDMRVERRCKVAIINGEDGQEELMRRVRAACQHFGITRDQITRRLLVIGARQIPSLTFNRSVPGGAEANEAGLVLLHGLIKQFGADVVMIDPLGSFLPGGMNDGASASAVSGRLTEMCVESNCAMLLVHHVSKAAMRAGDNDPTAALGSAMWANHARSVWNARRLTDEEAQAIGQLPHRVRDLLVLLHSKANLSRAEDAAYIEMVSVELPNASPPLHPRGDMIGVATCLKPGVLSDLFSKQLQKTVLDRIAKGTEDGLPFKPTGRKGTQDYTPAIVELLYPAFPADDEKQLEKLARSLISQFLTQGKLVRSKTGLPRKGSGKGGGKNEKVMLVNWAATEWAANPGAGPHVVGTRAPEGTEE